MDLGKTDPSDWIYINEGACNIVVGYTGEREELRNHVVRVPKATNIPRTQEDLAQWFSLNVVSQLLCGGEDIACVPRMLDSPGEQWLRELNRGIANARFRRDEDRVGIDVRVGQVECLENVVGERGIALELKPKWGFLPNPQYLSNDTRQTKLTHCRFCMHREMKMHNKGSDAESVRQRSNARATIGYCPLDLYSGDGERMTKALSVLVGNWLDGRRGSNLRVFVDGALLKGENKDTDTDTLAKALALSSFEQEKIVKSIVQQAVHVLRRSACLNTLATIQKHFDRIDIEGVSAVLGGHDVALDTDTIRQGCMGLVEAYLSRGNNGEDEAVTETREWSTDDYVIGYCISGAFKDCSVVLQLGSSKIKIMDVDLKAVGRVGHYARQDTKIVAHARACALDPCTP